MYNFRNEWDYNAAVEADKEAERQSMENTASIAENENRIQDELNAEIENGGQK
jgi:hypothetical protein